MKQPSRGFTLVEVLVVIAIIAILAVFATITLSSSRVKSRDAKRVAYINQINTALELYYLKNSSYPTTLTVGQPLSANGVVYLESVPTNPTPRTDGSCLNKEFYYQSDGAQYQLTFCLGNDTGRFKKGVNACQNNNCNPCDLLKPKDAEGYAYPTVAIGGQCWMAENLKTKTKRDGTQMTSGFDGSERDCINGVNSAYPACNPAASNARGNEDDCDCGFTLYTFPTAISTYPAPATAPFLIGPRGICPYGWHIPTAQEFGILLENYYNGTGTCGTNFATSGSHCAGAYAGIAAGTPFDQSYIGRRYHTIATNATTWQYNTTGLLLTSGTPWSNFQYALFTYNGITYFTATGASGATINYAQAVRCIKDTERLNPAFPGES